MIDLNDDGYQDWYETLISFTQENTFSDGDATYTIDKVNKIITFVSGKILPKNIQAQKNLGFTVR